MRSTGRAESVVRVQRRETSAMSASFCPKPEAGGGCLFFFSSAESAAAAAVLFRRREWRAGNGLESGCRRCCCCLFCPAPGTGGRRAAAAAAVAVFRRRQRLPPLLVLLLWHRERLPPLLSFFFRRRQRLPPLLLFVLSGAGSRGATEGGRERGSARCCSSSTAPGAAAAAAALLFRRQVSGSETERPLPAGLSFLLRCWCRGRGWGGRCPSASCGPLGVESRGADPCAHQREKNGAQGAGVRLPELPPLLSGAGVGRLSAP